MNILLIGGSCSLMNQLIIKFRKEGHRIYLLTGSKYTQTEYERVFETYRFGYNSEDLGEIFESVSPDVTIYLGAWDTNYNWKYEKQDAVRFVSGVMNILVAQSTQRDGRFYFLSSTEVFGQDEENRITEDTPVAPQGYRAAAYSQAEELCTNFQLHWNMDLTVLRIDRMFYLPKNRKEVPPVCGRMCLEALQDGCIHVNRKDMHSFIAQKDVVEFIHQAVRREEHRRGCYHLAAGDGIGEPEMAELIRNAICEAKGEEIEIIENETEEEDVFRHVVSGEKFCNEYGVLVLGDERNGIRKMAEYMWKHRAAFSDGTTVKEPLIKRILRVLERAFFILLPFLENLLAFAGVLWIYSNSSAGNIFANLDLFLLYVLLFAIGYGQFQATISGVFATGGYLYLQMGMRPGVEVMLDYDTYIWVVQIFILGLVVGYMKDQIRLIRTESMELESHLSGKIVDLKDINGSNVRVKKVLERQLIDHKDSIGTVYSITSSLDHQMTEEVLFNAVEVIEELMHTKDVAVYNVVSEGFGRLFSASSKKARSLGSRLFYQDMPELNEAIREKKVFLNRALDPNLPLMANAIYEEGEVKMILMLWGLDLEQMTLGQANYLAVVSYLIQNAVLRARRYMNALQTSRYQENTNIMDTEAFVKMIRLYLRAQERNLAECALLRVSILAQDYRVLAANLGGLLRDSDYLGVLEDGRLYIFLVNTNMENAQVVIRRLEERGCPTELVERIDL